jgi:hypothetical protein
MFRPFIYQAWAQSDGCPLAAGSMPCLAGIADDCRSVIKTVVSMDVASLAYNRILQSALVSGCWPHEALTSTFLTTMRKKKGVIANITQRQEICAKTFEQHTQSLLNRCSEPYMSHI